MIWLDSYTRNRLLQNFSKALELVYCPLFKILDILRPSSQDFEAESDQLE